MQLPALPSVFIVRGAGQQAILAEQQQAVLKMQPMVEIEFQRGDDDFAGGKVGGDFGLPAIRECEDAAGGGADHGGWVACGSDWSVGLLLLRTSCVFRF